MCSSTIKTEVRFYQDPVTHRCPVLDYISHLLAVGCADGFHMSLEIKRLENSGADDDTPYIKIVVYDIELRCISSNQHNIIYSYSHVLNQLYFLHGFDGAVSLGVDEAEKRVVRLQLT